MRVYFLPSGNTRVILRQFGRMGYHPVMTVCMPPQPRMYEHVYKQYIHRTADFQLPEMWMSHNLHREEGRSFDGTTDRWGQSAYRMFYRPNRVTAPLAAVDSPQPLCPLMLANVDASGSICFGAANMEDVRDLRSAWGTFWDATFNDHLVPGAHTVAGWVFDRDVAPTLKERDTRRLTRLLRDVERLPDYYAELGRNADAYMERFKAVLGFSTTVNRSLNAAVARYSNRNAEVPAELLERYNRHHASHERLRQHRSPHADRRNALDLISNYMEQYLGYYLTEPHIRGAARRSAVDRMPVSEYRRYRAFLWKLREHRSGRWWLRRTFYLKRNAVIRQKIAGGNTQERDAYIRGAVGLYREGSEQWLRYIDKYLIEQGVWRDVSSVRGPVHMPWLFGDTWDDIEDGCDAVLFCDQGSTVEQHPIARLLRLKNHIGVMPHALLPAWRNGDDWMVRVAIGTATYWFVYDSARKAWAFMNEETQEGVGEWVDAASLSFATASPSWSMQ